MGGNRENNLRRRDAEPTRRASGPRKRFGFTLDLSCSQHLFPSFPQLPRELGVRVRMRVVNEGSF